MDNYFIELNNVNVSEHIEKKNGLSYLSWAWCWAEIKKRHPDATYTIYEDADGLFYHSDGATCWVKTGVTVNGIEHIEYLPVMDFKNKSVPVGSVTSFDVNKAIQRSLTKACARHGLGLYIYAGEDLPEAETPKANPPADAATQKAGAVYEKSIIEMCAKTGTDTGKLCEYFKVDTLADLTTVQAIDAMKILEKKEKAK
jgi:hypothetical protein